MIKTNPLDISKYLKDETDIALFVEAAAQETNETNDPSILLEALAIVSKTKEANASGAKNIKENLL